MGEIGNRFCEVEGCNNKHYAKGYCNKHYMRLRTHGDPLFLKQHKGNKIHGMKGTTEYNTWINMKARCYNKNTNRYNRYGGRGITICDRWKDSFMSFHEDMGLKPFPEAQLDRKENDKGYYKSNCRWVTAAVNVQNRFMVKLTIEKAKGIRKQYATNDISMRKLALIYDVSVSIISNVVNNRTWKETD